MVSDVKENWTKLSKLDSFPFMFPYSCLRFIYVHVGTSLADVCSFIVNIHPPIYRRMSVCTSVLVQLGIFAGFFSNPLLIFSLDYIPTIEKGYRVQMFLYATQICWTLPPDLVNVVRWDRCTMLANMLPLEQSAFPVPPYSQSRAAWYICHTM